MKKKQSHREEKNQTKRMKNNYWLYLPKWLTRIYMLIMLGLFPVYFDNFGFTAILQAKYNFFFNLTVGYLILLLMICILLVLKRVWVVPPFRKIPGKIWRSTDIPQKAIFCLMIVASISAALAPDKSMVWNGFVRFEGLQTKLLYWLTFLAISVFGSFHWTLLCALWCSSTFMGVISILQYTGKNPFTLFPAGTCYLVSDLTRMFIGTVGNIDSTAGMSCIMLPIFFCSFVLYRNRSRFFLLIPLLLNIFVLLFTGVQQGVVGLGAGLILMLPFVSNTVQRMRNTMVALGLIFLTAAFQQMLAPAVMLGSEYANGAVVHFSFSFGKTSLLFILLALICAVSCFLLRYFGQKLTLQASTISRIIGTCLAVGLIAGLLFLYFSPAGKNPQHGLMYEGAQVLHGNMEESFGSNRFFVWKRVPALFRQYPVIGSGPDSFGPRFSAAYQQDMLIRFKKMLLFDHAENEYLSLLVNLGLIGLLLYLTLLGSQILRFLKMNKTTERIIFLSPLICASVQLFFTSSTIIVSPVFWIVWGLLNRSLRTPVVD
ncbi:MAG: hypothetical protein GYA26_09970 [Flexilinea flocculi]|nr:hypothetical protein [Flexilinea flocculi]